MKPVPVRPVDVRFREKTGKRLLALSFSGFDPERTLTVAVQQRNETLKRERSSVELQTIRG